LVEVSRNLHTVGVVETQGQAASSHSAGFERASHFRLRDYLLSVGPSGGSLKVFTSVIQRCFRGKSRNVHFMSPKSLEPGFEIDVPSDMQEGGFRASERGRRGSGSAFQTP
jgi:hypothetical protein